MEWIYNDVSELERHAYKFTCFDTNRGNIKVVLDLYEYQTRATTRHKYKTVAKYDRLRKNASTLKILDVPRDARIMLKAVDMVKSSVLGAWE